MKAKVISVAALKGGGIKTYTTFYVGLNLAKMGHKVLVVDADQQNDLGLLAKVITMEQLQGEAQFASLADVLEGLVNERTTTTVGEAMTVSPMCERLYVLPAGRRLLDVDKAIDRKVSGRWKFMRKALAQVAEQFDFILIDNGPELTQMLYNALACSEHVIVPVVPQASGFRSLVDLQRELTTVVWPELEREQPSILGVVATAAELTTTRHEVGERLLRMLPPEITILEIEGELKELTEMATFEEFKPFLPYLPKMRFLGCVEKDNSKQQAHNLLAAYEPVAKTILKAVQA